MRFSSSAGKKKKYFSDRIQYSAFVSAAGPHFQAKSYVGLLIIKEVTVQLQWNGKGVGAHGLPTLLPT